MSIVATNEVRVLIVEDSLLVAEDLANKLENVGYNVVSSVVSGEEALKVFKSQSVDLILMDINLDGQLNGIETAAEIKKERDLPIIYLTQREDEETFTKAKETYPDAYLSKPFNFRDVNMAIELAFNKSAYKEEESEDAIKEEEKEEDSYLLGDRIFIREGTAFKRINIDDLLWMEADRAYCRIVTSKQDYCLAISLKKFDEKVNHPKLVRVHDSFMVNIDKINAFEGNILSIDGVKQVASLHKKMKEINGRMPISKSYQKSFFKRFKFVK